MALAVYVRWWDLTLRLPGFLLWTTTAAALYLATAWGLRGRSALAVGPIRRAVGTWLAMVVLVLIAQALVPAIPIGGGVNVPSSVFVTVLDIALPAWIAIRAMLLLWQGPAAIGAVASLPACALALVWGVMIQMPGDSFKGPLPPLTPTQDSLRIRLEGHVRTLAATIGERNDGHMAALERAARYLDSTLKSLGYEVRWQGYTVGPQTFYNLEVTLVGRSRPEEIVVVGGHYDSVEGTPGADDNASGSAAVLELARAFRGRPVERTVKFVFFVNEEPPWFKTERMGSRVYADSAAARGDRIVAMFSLETVGYYREEAGSQRYPWPFSLFYPDRGDFIGFVGNMDSRGLVRRSVAAFRGVAEMPSEGVAAPALIPGVDWSDHAPFWLHGYRAVMISDTAPFRNPNYHQGQDVPGTLDFGRMARVVKGLEAVVASAAQG